MINIKQMLEQQMEQWESLGVRPQTLDKFVLEKGKVYQKITPWRGDPLKPKACFENAAKVVMLSPKEYTYAEGVMMMPNIPLSIHHAWLVDRSGNVVDPTIKDNRGYQYMGCEFSSDEVMRELVENGYYGLLMPDGIRPNKKLMRNYKK